EGRAGPRVAGAETDRREGRGLGRVAVREVRKALAVDVEIPPRALAVKENRPAGAPPARLGLAAPEGPVALLEGAEGGVVAVRSGPVEADLGLEARPAVPPAQREVRARGRE